MSGRSSLERDELFQTDDFRMHFMKVLQCPRQSSHDWSDCPYAHPQETARRRDPRVFSYTGLACPNIKQQRRCQLGDQCPYAHNTFEFWLHPTRYRTRFCGKGDRCQRKVCFFAHNVDELRKPGKPSVQAEAVVEAAAVAAAGPSPSLRHNVDASNGGQAATHQPQAHPRPQVPAPAQAQAQAEPYQSSTEILRLLQRQSGAQAGGSRRSSLSTGGSAPLWPEGELLMAAPSPQDAAVHQALAAVLQQPALPAAAVHSPQVMPLSAVQLQAGSPGSDPQKTLDHVQQWLHQQPLDQQGPEIFSLDTRCHSDPLGYYAQPHVVPGLGVSIPYECRRSDSGTATTAPAVAGTVVGGHRGPYAWPTLAASSRPAMQQYGQPAAFAPPEPLASLQATQGVLEQWQRLQGTAAGRLLVGSLAVPQSAGPLQQHW